MKKSFWKEPQHRANWTEQRYEGLEVNARGLENGGNYNTKSAPVYSRYRVKCKLKVWEVALLLGLWRFCL